MKFLRNTLGRTAIAAVATAGMALALAACSGSPAASSGGTAKGASTTTFTVATTSASPNFLPFYVAQQEGFYKDAGLDVKLITVNGGAVGMAAVESGKVQFFSGLPESDITAAAAGSKVRIYSAITDQPIYKLIGAKNVDSLQQLKGKKVGILATGNGTELLSQYLFDKKGPGASNVTYVVTGGTSARLAALEAGQVSATILDEPEATEAENKGYKVLSVLADEVPAYCNQVLLGLPTTVTQNPAAVKALIAGTVKASQWIYDNPTKAESQLVAYAKMDPSLAKQVLTTMIQAKDFSTTGRVPDEAITFSAGLFKKYTTDQVPADPTALLNMSYLPAAK